MTPHQHRFRLTYNLLVSPPDADGWVRKLFIRQGPLCPGAEVLHGTEHVQDDVPATRLTAWEEWTALGSHAGTGEDGGVTWEEDV